VRPAVDFRTTGSGVRRHLVRVLGWLACQLPFQSSSICGQCFRHISGLNIVACSFCYGSNPLLNRTWKCVWSGTYNTQYKMTKNQLMESPLERRSVTAEMPSSTHFEMNNGYPVMGLVNIGKHLRSKEADTKMRSKEKR
ncbi:hypothetical protein CEXT_585391, partial [Caerostris extrusa]